MPLTSEERCFPFLSSPVSHSGSLSKSYFLQQHLRHSLPLLPGPCRTFQLFKPFSGFLGLKERGGGQEEKDGI